MKKSPSATLRTLGSLALLSMLGPTAGCLDTGGSGHIQAGPSSAANMEGVRVELIRHSMGCDSVESQGLIVEVGPGLEYSAEAVRALKANCSLGPNPGIEVHVEDSSVVFDFSNVAEPGRFPDGEFEGYILDMVRTPEAPILIGALIDLQTSTLDAVQGDLSFDRDRLAVNMAGLAFDMNSFLRVDLYLLPSGDDGDASDGM